MGAGRQAVSVPRRLRLFNAYVLPVLCYNCGAWGLSTSATRELDAFHRRQIRAVLGIRWPCRVSNRSLQERFGIAPLGLHVAQCRLRLLGHVLRLDPRAPAQVSMDAYFAARGRVRGRPRWCLPNALQKDLTQFGHAFSNAGDLNALRDIAADREGWRRMVHMTTAVEGSESE